jgi:hypothetical protein
MAAITAAVVVGAGTLLTVYGQQEQKRAAKRAGELNARDAEENARLAQQQAEEDARQFRLSFRRDNAKNIAAIGASGIKNEGSPLEVLQDNASMAESDYQKIKAGGMQQRDAYLRQSQMYREGGAAAGRAADIASAASLLQGAGNTYTAGTKSGAWS